MANSAQKSFPNEPSQETWTSDKRKWEAVVHRLGKECPHITPFQAKVLYVVGMMRHMLEASGWTLSDGGSFLFPAYLLACGAVELLGRCVLTDEDAKSAKPQIALRRGLERMIEICPHCGKGSVSGNYSDDSWRDDDLHIVLSVNGHQYDIGYCKRLRNYMAHGMADARGKLHFTRSFLGRFICQACQGIDRYYEQLRADTSSGQELRQRLVNTVITPIWDNNGPVHIRSLYAPLLNPPFGKPCGKLLHETEWRKYCL